MRPFRATFSEKKEQRLGAHAAWRVQCHRREIMQLVSELEETVLEKSLNILVVGKERSDLTDVPSTALASWSWSLQEPLPVALGFLLFLWESLFIAIVVSSSLSLFFAFIPPWGTLITLTFTFP